MFIEVITADFNWMTCLRPFILLFLTCFIPFTDHILKSAVMLVTPMSLLIDDGSLICPG